jgi:hypothetical protein
MAMKNKSKQPARKPIDYKARMIGTMLRKLEANPSRRYKEVLTAPEYSEAVLMIRDAVAYVQGYMAAQRRNGKRVTPPRRFRYHGQSYCLMYGVFLGQIFIANKSGRALIGSWYNAI